MTERLILTNDATTLPRLEEISPLPARIGELEAVRQEKVSAYRQSLANLGELIERDLSQALECQDQVTKLEQEILGLKGAIDQVCTELGGVVTEKLTEARILMRRLNGHKSPALAEAGEAIAQAQERQREKDLTAALLKAEQGLSLLSGCAMDTLRASLAHHQSRLESL